MSIKALVKSKGWQDVKDLIIEEANKPPELKGQSAEEIGKEYMAFDMARKKIDAVLLKVEQIAQDEFKKEISYK